MKSVRWKTLLKLNEKMMRHEIAKLEKVTDLDTHVIQGSYSITSSSVSVHATPKAQRWFD